MAKLIKISDDAVINLDQVTLVKGSSEWFKIYFGTDHWIQYSYGLDEFVNMINDTPQLADENLQKELERVTRDYEELARECDQKDEQIKYLSRMNVRLLEEGGRKVYKKLTHEIKVEGLYDSESGDE